MTPGVVIVNRRAGGGGPLPVARIHRAIGHLGRIPPIIATRTTGEARAIIDEVAARRGELVAIAGGDGSVNLAINALAGADIPMAVIPLGTANDLATALEKRQPARRRIDLVRVNGVRFCTTGGLGIAADIALRIHRGRRGPGRRVLGTSIYALAAAEHTLFARICPRRVRIDYRGQKSAARTIAGEVHGVLVSNQATLAGSLTVCPRADHADGVFEIGLLHARGRLSLVAMLLRMRAGLPVPQSHLTIVRATEAHIESDSEGWFFGDGEPLVRHRQFALTIEPGALEVTC
ncbi:MAG TPA: diacylglycerol kinase family protein [Kofleriaceae bacterium]|nr:diacylglycerol kinase family protein [Kofleriaceae bacterium]